MSNKKQLFLSAFAHSDSFVALRMTNGTFREHHTMKQIPSKYNAKVKLFKNKKRKVPV
jgi:hypothetical protein